MIVIKVVLAFLILTGLMIGAYNISVYYGEEFTKPTPEEEEPEIYRR